MEKVAEINKERIVLTNGDLMMLVNKTPIQDAFEKMQLGASVSGKIYYWVFRVWTKIGELFQKMEKERMELVKTFCDKEEDGVSMKFIDAQYQFEPEQKKIYDAEMVQHPLPLVEGIKDEIAQRWCKKDKDGKPIKAGGTQVTFSGENQQKFTEGYDALLKAEHVFAFDKIQIDSELLEKLNGKLEKEGKEIILFQDMAMLEKIFDFVE